MKKKGSDNLETAKAPGGVAPAVSGQSDSTRSRWRVGRKVPINVYEGDAPVCQCQTATYARRIVQAMNAALERKP
jgi:hypothetical protein